jgi:hypothetical protein
MAGHILTDTLQGERLSIVVLPPLVLRVKNVTLRNSALIDSALTAQGPVSLSLSKG